MRRSVPINSNWSFEILWLSRNNIHPNLIQNYMHNFKTFITELVFGSNLYFFK